MALSAVTNSQFDTRLASVPGPYGPLTRSGTDTDLDTTPTLSPNSMIRYHVKSTIDTSVDIYISYDEMADSQVQLDIVSAAFGNRKALLLLEDWVTQLNAVINGSLFNSAIQIDSVLQAFIRMFVALPKLLGVIIPWEAFHEIDGHNREALNAAFTLVDVTNVITFHNTSTGQYQVALVDWGDGSTQQVELWRGEDLVHSYVGLTPGNYTVRLVIVGPKGVDFATDTVVV